MESILLEADCEIVVEVHQSTIKCSVMQSIQTKTISRIHPVFWVFSPWHYVARDQEFGNCNPGNAASAIVSGQDRGAEKMLVHADTHHALAFKSFFGQVAFVNLRDFFQLAPSKLCQEAFTLEGE